LGEEHLDGIARDDMGVTGAVVFRKDVVHQRGPIVRAEPAAVVVPDAAGSRFTCSAVELPGVRLPAEIRASQVEIDLCESRRAWLERVEGPHDTPAAAIGAVDPSVQSEREAAEAVSGGIRGESHAEELERTGGVGVVAGWCEEKVRGGGDQQPRAPRQETRCARPGFHDGLGEVEDAVLVDVREPERASGLRGVGIGPLFEHPKTSVGTPIERHGVAEKARGHVGDGPSRRGVEEQRGAGLGVRLVVGPTS
jgi:hypothetical protein